MAIPVQDIVDQVKTTLMDVNGVRWSSGELVEWVNAGVREIVRLVPDAAITTTDHALVAGARQTLPSGGVRLVDVVKNVTGGAAIRLMDRGVLDVYRPAWRGETAAAGGVKGYMYDPADPKTFEIFPGRDGNSASVTIVYQAVPEEADVGESLPLDDIYQSAIIEYVMFRAHSKDSEDSSPDLQRAQGYYNNFLMSLGLKQVADVMAEPPKEEAQ